MPVRTSKRRRLFERLDDLVSGADRFVDLGVSLHVVTGDEHGSALLPGKPPLRILRSHQFGGMFDTRSQLFCGPSLEPVRWHCSEKQEPLILHAAGLGPAERRVMLIGAMGGGKTEVLSKWALLSMIMLTGFGGLILVTSPTQERTRFPRVAVLGDMRPSWGKWSERDQTINFVNGAQIKFIGTKQNTKAQGSRIQGYNASRVASDEIQDSDGDGGIDGVDADIEARGRSAPNGEFRRMATATEKGSPMWRTYRDRIKSIRGKWSIERIAGIANPFVPAAYWEDLRQTMTERDYRRRVGALDVGPESATYPEWARDVNLRMVPDLGAEDVTQQVLSRFGPNYRILVGHDPGTICDVSLLLKAYRLRGEATHSWWVIGEVTTKGGTTESHVAKLLAELRKRGLNERDRLGRPVKDGPVALVRADPYGNTETKQRPHQTVYTVFRQEHLAIVPAAYKAGTSLPGQVPKNAGIEMVNTLCRDATGRTRLYVACDSNRLPYAPRLVEALEMSERDAAGEAETERKDAGDLSHWPAALRYALWAMERPRIEQRQRVTA